MDSFDVLVVGSGTSGYTLAHGLARAGKRVAVADEREFGGTCALRGCQPKKYLVANAEILHLAGNLQGKGLDGQLRANWRDLIELKRGFTDGVPGNTEQGFAKAGIELLHGTARFTASDELMVGERQVRAGTIVLAVGTVPAALRIPGGELARDSEYFMDMEILPRRIVFVGGGYISFELAAVAHAAGAETTILHRSQQPLKQFDPDLVNRLVSAMDADGLKVLVNHPVEAIEESAGALVVTAGGDEFDADLVINASGRVPDFASLELARGNVEAGPKGIVVNSFLQSPSNPKVFAIGDCVADSPQLATVADMEGEVAAHNILHGLEREPDYDHIPSAVFSQPPIASVGLSEREARSGGYEYRIKKANQTSWPSSKRIGQRAAGYKVLIDTRNERILGAHILGHNAPEAINVFALAMKFGHSGRDLQSVLWAYPTHTSDMKYSLR